MTANRQIFCLIKQQPVGMYILMHSTKRITYDSPFRSYTFGTMIYKLTFISSLLRMVVPLSISPTAAHASGRRNPE